MTILIDSREKPRAITKIVNEFDAYGIKYITNKCPVGDYMSLDNARLSVDRKQSLLELCSNVCQQHARFKAELIRANDLGIKLVFLCEHGRNVKTLDDVMGWQNPRIKQSPLAVSGERLYRILSAMSQKYNTEFIFCEKKDTGRKIIEILGGDRDAN